MKPKRVLIAPLDWGLGHATRCIPVIRELQRCGCETAIAGSGDAIALLRGEFPDVPAYSLPGYAPKYPSKGSMALRMASQLPGFIRVIRSEHRTVNEIIRRQDIDILISDNRYGCWSHRIPSVFITHQGNIMMPEGLGFLHAVVRKQNERMINRFHACWIPDFPSGQSLAGELASSGKVHLKTKVEYIGWLSRFRKATTQVEKRFDVLAVFSGPEPQRTIFEDVVVAQLKTSGLRYRVVRGLPESNGLEDNETFNFLGSAELKSMIESSELVIARSGYSTVMDLAALAAKAVLIPTPGQTEQEYLSRRLMEKKVAFTMPQDQFNIETAIRESKKFTGFVPSPENDLLRQAITKLVG